MSGRSLGVYPVCSMLMDQAGHRKRLGEDQLPEETARSWTLRAVGQASLCVVGRFG